MYILIYITCKNKKEAEVLSLALLKKRLVACCNIFKIESMYNSKKTTVKVNEHLLLAKTKRSKFDKIKQVVTKLHSYDIPAIISYKIDDANDSYLDWIDGALK